ncbi:hypothetical protein EV383_2387 [Pseudonocardia sediminis]|uniref:Uncharacterized protein n=1 Tax=Pseudonocardia sediminis TaxID=1397368 RepID=A0A4Q7UU99_PSEST|nr:hypothetical protein EV383_2387 [Pseudonocardia sediminis]
MPRSAPRARAGHGARAGPDDPRTSCGPDGSHRGHRTLRGRRNPADDGCPRHRGPDRRNGRHHGGRPGRVHGRADPSRSSPRPCRADDHRDAVHGRRSGTGHPGPPANGPPAGDCCPGRHGDGRHGDGRRAGGRHRTPRRGPAPRTRRGAPGGHDPYAERRNPRSGRTRHDGRRPGRPGRLHGHPDGGRSTDGLRHHRCSADPCRGRRTASTNHRRNAPGPATPTVHRGPNPDGGHRGRLPDARTTDGRPHGPPTHHALGHRPGSDGRASGRQRHGRPAAPGSPDVHRRGRHPSRRSPRRCRNADPNRSAPRPVRPRHASHGRPGGRSHHGAAHGLPSPTSPSRSVLRSGRTTSSADGPGRRHGGRRPGRTGGRHPSGRLRGHRGSRRRAVRPYEAGPHALHGRRPAADGCRRSHRSRHQSTKVHRHFRHAADSLRRGSRTRTRTTQKRGARPDCSARTPLSSR